MNGANSNANSYDQHVKDYIAARTAVMDVTTAAITGTETRGLDEHYQASFAEKGKSGLSFGACQNDVANNGAAADTFEDILRNNEAVDFTDEEIDQIMSGATKKGTTKDDIPKDSRDKVNQALSSNYGKAAVDKLDQKSLDDRDWAARNLISNANNYQNGGGVFAYGNVDPKAVALAAA